MSLLRQTLLASLALVLFALSATAVRADSVVIGGTNLNSSSPFGSSGSFPYTGHYQQVYSSTAFSGPLTLVSVAFASGSPSAALGNGAGPATYNLSVSLSTTSAAVGGLSTNYGQNVGANNTVVFSGTVTAILTQNNSGPNFDLVIVFSTPFTYDPSQGNLLLDIFMNSSSNPENFFWAGSNDPRSSRVYNFTGSGSPTASNISLLTQFTSVPEPATLVLLGTGLVGAWGAARKRRLKITRQR